MSAAPSLPQHLTFSHQTSVAPNEYTAAQAHKRAELPTWNSWYLTAMMVVLTLPLVAILGIAGAPLGAVAGFQALLVALGASLDIAGTFLDRRGKVLSPMAAAEQRENVRSLLTKFRIPASLKSRKGTLPELESLRQEGRRLGKRYDELLTQWAQATWADEHSPSGQHFQEASDTLVSAIEQHVSAFEERVVWEEARRCELTAPLVQDAEMIAASFQAEAAESLRSAAQDRSQVKIQTQVLASLQKGEVPQREYLAQ